MRRKYGKGPLDVRALPRFRQGFRVSSGFQQHSNPSFAVGTP